MSPSSPESHEVVKLDLSAGSIHATLVDGQPHIVLKSAIEDLGLDYSTQLAKLKTRSWASVGQSPMQMPGDDQIRSVTVVPVRTFVMLLATVNENRVKAAVRPTLIAFQNETADAIEAYWTSGGAINPTASVEQVETLRTQLDGVERAQLARERLSAMGVAKQFGLVNASYMEAMARTELARMNGEEPDIDPADITITCDEYLDGRIAPADLGSARTRLGKTVAALYRARYDGKDPQKIKRPIHGVHRDVAVYTHRDVDLFDTAWAEVSKHYDVQDRFQLGGAA